MADRVVVIKIGSNILARKGYGLNARVLKKIVDIVSEVHSKGFKPLIVSSGAIACGMQLLGFKERPKDITGLQAAASVGQSHLVESYAVRFRKKGLNVGQVLLTRSDFLSRDTYTRARKTLERLLKLDVIPIINENDAVAIEEIKFGDNDTLAALVAAALSAEYLFLLSNVDGLLKDPRNPGTLIERLDGVDEETLALAKPEKSEYGSGGMQSKLRAAMIAGCAGVSTLIVNGFKPERIVEFLDSGKTRCTFIPAISKVSSKKHWIAFVLEPQGEITIDEGAAKALIEKNKSLLAAGITDVKGKFSAGDAVDIRTANNQLIAKGISEFSDEEIKKIKGLSTAEIRKIMGEDVPEEVVHRDRMIIYSKILKGGIRNGSGDFRCDD